MSPGTIYARTPTGALECGLCHGLDHAHARDCALVAIHAQVRELSASLGLFVATMRESVDAIEALLRGEAE